MVTIPINLTIRDLKPVKSDSLIFPYPIKTITGYHRVGASAGTGFDDMEQATRFADSFKGTEIMFNIILNGDARNTVIGHMYEDGTHGEFIFINHANLIFFNKINGVWQRRNL